MGQTKGNAHENHTGGKLPTDRFNGTVEARHILEKILHRKYYSIVDRDAIASYITRVVNSEHQRRKKGLK